MLSVNLQNAIKLSVIMSVVVPSFPLKNEYFSVAITIKLFTAISKLACLTL